jgi:hypothetical protein
MVQARVTVGMAVHDAVAALLAFRLAPPAAQDAA